MARGNRMYGNARQSAAVDGVRVFSLSPRDAGRPCACQVPCGFSGRAKNAHGYSAAYGGSGGRHRGTYQLVPAVHRCVPRVQGLTAIEAAAATGNDHLHVAEVKHTPDCIMWDVLKEEGLASWS